MVLSILLVVSGNLWVLFDVYILFCDVVLNFFFCTFVFVVVFFFFQAEDGIRDLTVTGVQTCALPISLLDCRIPGWTNLKSRSVMKRSILVVLIIVALACFAVAQAPQGGGQGRGGGG